MEGNRNQVSAKLTMYIMGRKVNGVEKMEKSYLPIPEGAGWDFAPTLMSDNPCHHQR